MGLIAPRSLAAPVAPLQFAVLPVTPRCGPVYARTIRLSRPISWRRGRGRRRAAKRLGRRASPVRQPPAIEVQKCPKLVIGVQTANAAVSFLGAAPICSLTASGKHA